VQRVDLKGRLETAEPVPAEFRDCYASSRRGRDGVRRKDEPVHPWLKGKHVMTMRARTGRHRRRRKAATLDPERRLDKEQEYIFPLPLARITRFE